MWKVNGENYHISTFPGQPLSKSLEEAMDLSQDRPLLLLLVGLERGPLSLLRITEGLLALKSSGSGSRKPRLTAMGIRCADHAAPPISANVGINFADKRRSLVGIVRLRTKATEFSFFFVLFLPAVFLRQN
jgi:hypothetical protein